MSHFEAAGSRLSEPFSIGHAGTVPGSVLLYSAVNLARSVEANVLGLRFIARRRSRVWSLESISLEWEYVI